MQHFRETLRRRGAERPIRHRGERLDEAELIAGLRARDPVAERRFYDLHVENLYRLALGMTGDVDTARLCTQDAFIRAFAGIDGFRGDARLSTWLHSITVSVVLDRLRRLKRLQDREVALDPGLRAPPGAQFRIEPDLRERLREEVRRLPDIYRVVVVMHDLEGFTHDDIARVLGIAPGTSRARLSRARGMLRDALDEFAGEALV